MKLDYLFIDGFKNLEEFEIDFKDKNKLTVLIGNNGSGKSNILEAICSIFTGLYKSNTPQRKPNFDYKITYTIRNNKVHIELKKGNYSFKINDNKILKSQFVLKQAEYLPSEIVACYSGEEKRLWNNYFIHFYNDFKSSLLKEELQTIPAQQLLYVNKYYWNIALLTFLYSDLKNVKDFVSQTLGINSVGKVTFKFNVNNLRKYKNNVVVNFLKILNPKQLSQVTLSIQQLRKLNLGYEKEFFTKLTAAYMPKDSKLITDVVLSFNNELDTHSLSEGEKKLILIKLILEFLAEENSLVLLDEPDSHLHISRKEILKELLKQYENRENVITTHSPMLTHCFDLKHITMLTKDAENKVKVVEREKQDVIDELTGGIWTYQEQNIFLSSRKDIILVEGKTDITYIQTAIDKLKGDHTPYSKLEFEFLPFGGAAGLQLFIDKFTPIKNQKIIALLDRDEAGLESIRTIFGFQGALADYTTRQKNGIYVVLLPKTRGYNNDNFIIEDYYGIEFLKEIMFQNAVGLLGVLKDKNLKRKLDSMCKNDEIDKTKFVGFKSLLDDLVRMKNPNYVLPIAKAAAKKAAKKVA